MRRDAKKRLTVIIIIVTVNIVLITMIGYGIYAWQDSRMRATEQTMHQQIAVLIEKIEQLQNSIEQYQREINQIRGGR